jgi:valyl-tRNA synthetase
MGIALDAVTMARNVRQESGLGPRAPVKVDLVSADKGVLDVVTRHAALIQHLAVLSSVEMKTRDGYSAPKLSSVQSSGTLEVVVHLEGLIDVEKEKARLKREIEKAEKEKSGLAKRFENEDFVKKAPPEVVAEGKANIAALDEKIARFSAALTRLS